MTNEELDRARAEEAYRLWMKDSALDTNRQMGTIAARLAREGWVPVDPDLVKAREIVNHNYTHSAATETEITRGIHDNSFAMKVALAGIKYGRESRDAI